MKRFGDIVYEWMVNYKKNSVKPATYDRLKTSFDMMERYGISWMSFDSIDSDSIQAYLNELVKDGYALSTIKKQYHLITSFMNYANVKGIIDRPYHKGVKLPSPIVVKKPKRGVIAYTESEQKRLRKIFLTRERPAYIAAFVMLESGMRIGEVLALRWSDINWSRKCVRIDKTFVRLGNASKQYVQNEAKSYSSNRVIPLSTALYDFLKDIRESDGFIVHNENGKPLTYEAVRWQIKLACREADVPYYGQHVFRHTFATNCYNRGCDVKILSKLLGHADVTITYNIYIHLFGDALEELRSVLV